MSLSTSKSLEKYLEECISQFNYSDFSPPINNTELAGKFESILHRKNAYWEKCKPADEWPRWLFIQFKSFKNTSYILGLNFENDQITFTLTETVNHNALHDPHNQTRINLFDVWLDHNILCTKFIAIFNEGIAKSNL